MMHVLRYFNTASWWLCRLLSYLSVSLTAYEVSDHSVLVLMLIQLVVHKLFQITALFLLFSTGLTCTVLVRTMLLTSKPAGNITFF